MGALTYDDLIRDVATPVWVVELVRHCLKVQSCHTEEAAVWMPIFLKASVLAAEEALAAEGVDRGVEEGGGRTEGAGGCSARCSLPGPGHGHDCGQARGGSLCLCGCHVEVSSSEERRSRRAAHLSSQEMPPDSTEPSPGNGNGARRLEEGDLLLEGARARVAELEDEVAQLRDAGKLLVKSGDKLEDELKATVEEVHQMRGQRDERAAQCRKLEAKAVMPKLADLLCPPDYPWMRFERPKGAPPWTEAILTEVDGRLPLDLIKWLPAVCCQLLQVHAHARRQLLTEDEPKGDCS